MADPSSNALLNSYRSAGVAGNYPRMKTEGGIGYMFQERGAYFGPSHAALESWKRSGIPTSETMPSQAFGMSTRKGDTAGDALSFDNPAPPLPNYARAPAGKVVAPRANPITWEGAEPEPQPHQRRPALDAAAYERQMQQQAQQPQQMQQKQSVSAMQTQSSFQPELSPEQMQETWAHLLRTRQTPSQLSSAQCLIQMPPEYANEMPPSVDDGIVQGMLTIGLHAHGKQVKRSNQFTSDFRDPFY